MSKKGVWLPPLVVKSDFLHRISQANPIDAIEELIWNGLDEKATNIEVRVVRNGLDGLESVTVIDNGTGMSHEMAKVEFPKLGESNKVNRRDSNGESLHGKLGQGRTKAFAIGKRVDWNFVYRDGDQKLMKFSVQGTKDLEAPFFLSEEVLATDASCTGCSVVICECDKNHFILSDHRFITDLTSRLAVKLMSNPSLKIRVNGRVLNPRKNIKRRRVFRTISFYHEGTRHSLTVEIIEWEKGIASRDVFLCGESGIPLHRARHHELPSTEGRTVFIKSSFFDRLHDENLLQTLPVTGDPELKELADRLKKFLKRDIQRSRNKAAEEMINRLKEEGSYPYLHEPSGSIEEVERNVFDLCAIKISKHLSSFQDGMDVDGRKLMLRMVKEAVTTNPSTVGRIIREVCKLPAEDAKKFSNLLDDVPLSRVIDMSHRVANRLEFLKAFKAIVTTDPFEEQIRERSQLQKLVGDNLWIFGEEYALGTDDQSIETVLRKHISILNRDNLQPHLSESEVNEIIQQRKLETAGTEESLQRIPDFMIWRQFIERRPSEYEFLVIEIKRPGVKIGIEEFNQIQKYAEAVANTKFTDKDATRWVFIVVSDDLSPFIKKLANQENLPKYTILKPKDENYEVRAMPWSAIVQSCEGRHEHLRQWLDHKVSMSDSLSRTKNIYKELQQPNRVKTRKRTASTKNANNSASRRGKKSS